MRFAEPIMFNFLWLAFGLIIFLYWAWSHRGKKIEQFVEKKLVNDLVSRFSGTRWRNKKVLLVIVFILSIIALARPQWGFEWQEVRREGVDILVVVDTSKSMLAQDVKPNRLERTKLAIKDLLRKLQGDRIGLIAFAGDAFLLCPLTVDYQGFLLSLNDLNVDTIPRGGTNLASAIQEAMESYKDVPNKYKAIIIITDGDNLEGDPLVMAQKAKAKGIKIYTIGIGTKEGELIQIKDSSGNNEFLKDADGNFVKSRLNEEVLQQIALVTGGVYVKSSGAQFGLDVIFDSEISKLEKREFGAEKEKKYYERFQIPLAVAFLALLVETCMGTRKKEGTNK